VVVGSLKLPGFSEYMHPLGGGMLMGFGRDADLDGRVDGYKLTLFDVSDPSDPIEVSSTHVLDDGYISEASYDHKAFSFSPDGDMFCFPASGYVTGGNPGMRSNIIVLVGVTGETGFTILGTFDNSEVDYYSMVNRGIFAGGALITVSSGRVRAYETDGQDPLDTVLMPYDPTGMVIVD
jgi:hypothetical protein